MLALRKWQAECIEQALRKYSSGNRHFFTVATPGAGKTVLAAEIAKQLLALDKIDLVLCFSPSIEVSAGFAETIEQQTGYCFRGLLGSLGRSLTYQSLGYLNDDFWRLLNQYRVLVICDEIHHCAGSDYGAENTWGKILQEQIYHQAAYTLALSGTPWRSDKVPIALADYSENNTISYDYIYGLLDAVNDRVCRIPKIVAIDSDEIVYSEGDNPRRDYQAIRQLLSEEEISYQSLLENSTIVQFILQRAVAQLNKLNVDTPNAGGLVVASNVKHAKMIYRLLVEQFNQSAVIVTYQSEEPGKVIQKYKSSFTQWIVSVGMVSEGTNIPRLQVCCHLSRIKTELYFRQVLGRILRYTATPNPYGYLYILAEERLLNFAHRVEQDLPDEEVMVLPHATTNRTPNSNKETLGSNTLIAPEQVISTIDITTAEQVHQQKESLPVTYTHFQKLYEEILQLHQRFQC